MRVPTKADKPPLTFKEKVSKASRITAGCSWWITAFNLVLLLVALIAAPFTLCATLLLVPLIPLFEALGSIASDQECQTQLMRLHLELLADKEGLG